jgi:hypothetical protein
MMTNKWVQAAILFGMAIGFLAGGLLPLIHYVLPILAAFVAGLGSMWMVSYAQGTDGWGRPWSGPKKTSK